MEEGQTCLWDYCSWPSGPNSEAASYIKTGIDPFEVGPTWRKQACSKTRDLFGVVGWRRTHSSQGSYYVTCKEVNPLFKKMSVSYTNIIQASMK